MRTEPRPAPKIPDHEVLRKIGSGAYGEVWLARSVTGAWRAVKVVCREDFEDERTFEREFDGVLRYEPISRDHPSLVHVLHVGRTSEPEPLYYYVMELGDDRRQGQRISAVEYEPRTLRSEVDSDGERIVMAVDEVVDIGISLAEGLQHLHDQGLAHRDVKPANVIFIEGRAKLADLGLVAARDQRTFVGTEGFVPPEGPGSANADIYSLGKVLYELATGLDRMQFPELPDELPKGDPPAKWRRLNGIICDVCEPRLEDRGIKTGAELAEALRALKEGRRATLAKSSRKTPLALAILACLIVAAVIWMPDQFQSSPTPTPLDPALVDPQPPNSAQKAKRFAEVVVVSDPSFAEISLANGDPIIDRYGDVITETGVPFELEVGTVLQIRFFLAGYRTEVSEPMVVTESGLDIFEELVRFSPPSQDIRWTDSQGMQYTPMEGYHLSDRSLSLEAYQDSLAEPESVKVPLLAASAFGQSYQAVLLTEEEMSNYLGWLRSEGIREGNLSKDFGLSAVIDDRVDASQIPQDVQSQGRHPYRIRVAEIFWGSVALDTKPSGAAVLQDGALLGFTSPNFKLAEVKPGALSYEITLDGYKKVELNLQLAPRENLSRIIELEPNNSAKFGQMWTNSLAMKLIPVGDALLVAVNETRVQDFQAYLAATGAEVQAKVDFEQKPDEPISMISHDEARAFCAWLTAKEQGEELINKLHHYRLPTDEEWSQINGLEEKQASPRKRHARRKQYPWGEAWPPGQLPEPVANMADRSAAAIPGVAAFQTIQGYDDGFAYTAPVGSFPANQLGFFDLGGNVREWIADSYGGTGGLKNRKFTRGGGFLDFRALSFDLGHRDIPQVDAREPDIGFRVVLARNPDAF